MGRDREAPRPTHRLRLLHTSDLHVGSRLPTVGPTPAKALDLLASLAIRLEIDVVLVAGDFFDHSRVDEATVAAAAEQLARIPAPVVLLPGNHDPYRDESPWVRCASRFPDNAHVISRADGEIVHLAERGLQVWGQAHTHFEDFRPAARKPAWRTGGEGREDWRVAMAHGIHVSDPYHLRFSYQIETRELVDLDAHYVALGHLDEHARVGGSDVHAYYASSPLRSGAFALVNLSPEAIEVRQVDASGPVPQGGGGGLG